MCEICANAKRIALETNYKALSLISSPEYLKQIGDSAIEETQLEYSNQVEKIIIESVEAERLDALFEAYTKDKKKKANKKDDKKKTGTFELSESQVASMAMERVGAAGRRLLQNPEDEYAATEATKAIINKVNLAEMHENPYYKKYYPKNAKTGKTKEISFRTPFLCGWENQYLVPIYVTKKGKVFFGNLLNCGKVWTCPHCGAKINVRRREEIKQIIKKALKGKKSVLMLTLTAPHSKGDTLLSLTERMAQALYHLQNSRAWKNHIQKGYNGIGNIRAMETMLGGKSGAHTHFHIVLIFDFEIDAKAMAEMQETILAEWERSCVKARLLNPKDAKTVEKFRNEAVKLTRNFGYDYLTKQASQWKKEMRDTILPRALGMEYKKEEHGLTPFGFVADLAVRVALGKVSQKEFARECELFIEYCCSTHGRRQIVFSRGLRKWSRLYEGVDGQGNTDEELSNMQSNRASVIGALDKRQHRFARQNIYVKNIKNAVEQGGEAALLGSVNEWFEKHGLGKVYTKEEAKLYIQAHDLARGEDYDLFKYYELEEKILKNRRAIIVEEERLDFVRKKKKAAGG